MDRLSKLRAMTRNVRTSTSILLWVFSVFAIALFTASFIVPPTGIIDPSVLKASGILFGFAALAEAREAILEGLGVKVTHGDTTIVIHDLDGKEGDADPNNEGRVVGEFHQSGDGDAD